MITIDLEKYRTPGSKVFTGRDRGKTVRELTHIDELVPKDELVEIVVPADIRSINPSFLEEFLNNVVIKLGSLDAFYKKINFNSLGKYDVKSDLEEAVERILRQGNALAHK
jgi:hypothetical protein